MLILEVIDVFLVGLGFWRENWGGGGGAWGFDVK
jgi:hypothetical protein